MANIANIAIADGKASPETHTFNSLLAGVTSKWRTADGALPLVGQEVVDARLKRINSSLGCVQLVLDLPALETATGANSSGYTAAPKVAFNHRVKVELFLPDRGTAAQRKDLRVLLRNLLADANIVSLIDDLVPPM